MSFASKFPTIKESILLTGTAGAGKSTAVIDVAIKMPDVKVFVVDAELGGSWTPDGGRMNPGREVPNIEAKPATEWSEFRQAVKSFSRQGKGDDWLCIDMIGPTMWDMVQEFYVDTVKSKNIEDFFLEHQKKGKSGNPFGGDTDWVAIKKMYHSALADILTFPGHVICLAGVKSLGERDQKTNRELYGHIGLRPAGEGSLSHSFATILYMKQKGQKEWMFTTIRDRNGRVGPQREYVENKTWSDFSRAYLWDVAGWRPGR